MSKNLQSVWAVERHINPHIPHSGNGSIVVLYANKADAENFISIHPQHHYKLGEKQPQIILELRELPLGEVAHWWTPGFP